MDQEFHNISFFNSFRSQENILKLVDEIFKNPIFAKSISKSAQNIKHQAIKNDFAGKVEIWPPQINKNTQEDIFENHFQKNHSPCPKESLAKKIAQQIKSWINNNKILKSQDRCLKYSDIMILTQSRSHNFANILIKQFDLLSIPHCGIDKINLLDEICILDLLSLAKFTLLCDDDLNLAALLKSPIISLSEDQLQQLCKAKNKQNISLYCALKQNQEFVKVVEFLEDAVKKSQNSDIYQFFCYILYQKRVLKKITSYFGKNITIIIQQFLEICLNGGDQIDNIYNLQNFVDFLENNHLQVKKDTI